MTIRPTDPNQQIPNFNAYSVSCRNASVRVSLRGRAAPAGTLARSRRFANVSCARERAETRKRTSARDEIHVRRGPPRILSGVFASGARGGGTFHQPSLTAVRAPLPASTRTPCARRSTRARRIYLREVSCGARPSTRSPRWCARANPQIQPRRVCPARACRSVSASCVSPQMRIHQRSPPFPPSSQNRVVTASPLPSSVRRWIVDLGESCVSPALLHGARWGFPARDGRWLAAPPPPPPPPPPRGPERDENAPPAVVHPISRRAAPSRRRRAAHAHSDPPRPRISRGSPTGGRCHRRFSSRRSPRASPAAAAG